LHSDRAKAFSVSFISLSGFTQSIENSFVSSMISQSAIMRLGQAEKQLPITRINFRKYLANNPNYFGNFPDAGFKPIEEISNVVRFEQLTCIGLNQNLNQLEGTIAVKLPFGYYGNLCTSGSREYVRFYIDYGAGFQPLGYASVNVHDIPNANSCESPDKPLCYTVSLPFVPNQKFCWTPVLPLVRGILSWDVPPPAGMPNWVPVWGNVLDQHIQIMPRPFWLFDILYVIPKDIISKLPSQLTSISDHPIPLPDPPPADLQALSIKYGSNVASHRFGFSDLYQAITGSVTQPALLDLHKTWSNIKLDFPGALAALEDTSGDIDYEELYCLGLDYSNEYLVATFRIKLPYGYSGDLCQAGSTEYVAFWSDWDSDACTLSYLGTAQVQVHDIPSIPKDGLSYSAVIAVDLRAVVRSCESPNIAHVRAVLSWNSPPSTTDPTLVPIYGNVIDCHVQIPPGVPNTGLSIYAIGGVNVDNIDTASGGSGLTVPNKVSLEGQGLGPNSRPFGGEIRVKGYPPVDPQNVQYRIRVRQHPNQGTETFIINQFDVSDFNGNTVHQVPDVATGYVQYLGLDVNPEKILAKWETSMDGPWDIRLESMTFGVPEPPGPWYRIELKNSTPTATIIRTSPSSCEDIVPGTDVSGVFSAYGPYFSRWSLSLSPSGSTPLPVPFLATTSEAFSNGWCLDTTHLTACGYTVYLDVFDLSIIDSDPAIPHYSQATTVFCLKPSTNQQGAVWDTCEDMNE
jgi:hypothetical protein